MGRRARIACLALLALPAFSQTEFRKHNFTGGLGGAVPSRDISGLFSTSPVFRFNYGYRFSRFFQADAGLDTVFHAAEIRDFFDSAIGPLRIRDYQFMLGLGGRTILPLASDRVLLSFGGGASYLRYQEFIRQPFSNSGFRFDCPVCGRRSGWGYYGLIGFSVALDRAQHFRIGASTRVFRANVEGDSFGDVRPFRTNDAWVNTAAEFTFSF